MEKKWRKRKPLHAKLKAKKRRQKQLALEEALAETAEGPTWGFYYTFFFLFFYLSLPLQVSGDSWFPDSQKNIINNFFRVKKKPFHNAIIICCDTFLFYHCSTSSSLTALLENSPFVHQGVQHRRLFIYSPLPLCVHYIGSWWRRLNLPNKL